MFARCLIAALCIAGPIHAATTFTVNWPTTSFDSGQFTATNTDGNGFIDTDELIYGSVGFFSQYTGLQSSADLGGMLIGVHARIGSPTFRFTYEADIASCPLYGALILCTDDELVHSYEIRTSEAGGATWDPASDPVPLPASASLLLAAFGALALRRRRR